MSINKRRSRLDIYASILEVAQRFDEGVRITRLSYGVGMPVDRLRVFIKELERYGFMAEKTGENDEKLYSVTARGARYLKTYWQLVGLLEPIEEE